MFGLKQYGMPERPRIIHNLLYAVTCSVSFTEEPDAGDLHVRFCEICRSILTRLNAVTLLRSIERQDKTGGTQKTKLGKLEHGYWTG